MTTYFTSDLHFNHITHDRTEFSNIKHYNNTIIKMINKKVKNDDILYILGDIGFGNNLKQLINSINGTKILIKGNHDTKPNDFYLNIGFSEVYNHPIFYDKHIVLSHEPFQCNDYIVNIHGHLHGAKLANNKYFNVNLFENNMKVISEKEINKFINGKFKGYKEKFLTEWYADLYLFSEKSLKERSDLVVDENTHIIKLQKTKEKVTKLEQQKIKVLNKNKILKEIKEMVNKKNI